MFHRALPTSYIKGSLQNYQLRLQINITKDREVVVTKDFARKLLLLSLIWANLRWFQYRPT